jgi:hypothetical protein
MGSSPVMTAKGVHEFVYGFSVISLIQKLTMVLGPNTVRPSSSGKGRVASVFVSWSWMRVGRHEVAPRRLMDIGWLKPI